MLRRPRWLALAARPFGHALAGHAPARRSPGRGALARQGLAGGGLATAPWLLAAVPGLPAVRRRPAWALGAAVWPVLVHPVFPAGLRDAPLRLAHAFLPGARGSARDRRIRLLAKLRNCARRNTAPTVADGQRH